jgi:hypothetical protein
VGEPKKQTGKSRKSRPDKKYHGGLHCGDSEMFAGRKCAQYTRLGTSSYTRYVRVQNCQNNAIMGPRFYGRTAFCSSGHVCVRTIHGEFIFSSGCVCARVCVRVLAECSKINAHVHWVPLDANPGGQVELLLNAPPDAGRQSEIYFACRCA